jgi:hypothetical protein
MIDLQGIEISALVRESWEVGQAIDLEGVGYGRVHWGNFKDIKKTASPYYHFLAGLVKHLGIRRVLEIGTHSGGSAVAMEKGFVDGDGLIVTVDITKESDRYLSSHPSIIKVRGDANKEKVVYNVLDALDWQPVDLLFIDGDHKFFPALLNYSMFATLVSPCIVCLDDILLNAQMTRLWELLSRSVPSGCAVNAAEIVSAIRPGTPGFGCIVRC